MMNEKLSFEEQRRSHLFEDAFLLYWSTGATFSWHSGESEVRYDEYRIAPEQANNIEMR